MTGLRRSPFQQNQSLLRNDLGGAKHNGFDSFSCRVPSTPSHIPRRIFPNIPKNLFFGITTNRHNSDHRNDNIELETKTDNWQDSNLSTLQPISFHCVDTKYKNMGSSLDNQETENSPLRLSTSSNEVRRFHLGRVWILATGIFAATMFGTISFILMDKPPQNISTQTSVLGSTHQRRVIDEDEGVLNALRDEFIEWAKLHRRKYSSEEEHNKRYNIWKENHDRTIEKNKRHGPCKMTKQPVFGSNHLKDLSPEEFKAGYLTGYGGPTTDKLGGRRRLRSDQRAAPRHSRAPQTDIVSSDGTQDPRTISRHDSVQERYLKHLQEAPLLHKTYYNSNRSAKNLNCYYSKTYHGGSSNSGSSSWTKNDKSTQRSKRCNTNYQEALDVTHVSNARKSSRSCRWYDISCWLKGIFLPIYGSSNSGSDEPEYDGESYPSQMDWREVGAVTDVRSQGSCGACWAITAVETIESAYFIAFNSLLDLSETEIITCDDTCEMCNGGWPQNAYEFVMENGGVLPASSMSFDGDFLMTLTMVTNGESDEMTDDQVEEYLDSVCPDRNGNSASRYAEIKDYAYATDRCICYTDGSGCDCDEQDEALAVMNLASYGPATICLDASVFQDYTGGIMTADSGCSSAFLNMNHCIQVVGYRFTDVSYDDDEEDSKSNSHSGDDNSSREGYWIVRNQWSSYWGMNGYAYIAMGSNTCGVLNDMTQVFMD